MLQLIRFFNGSTSLVGPGRFFSFLIYSQSLVLLGWVISSSQCLFLKHRTAQPSTNFPRTQKWIVAPFVLKVTPLHGPNGRHRLQLLWMHVCRCIAWQQTSYISVLSPSADGVENAVSLLLLQYPPYLEAVFFICNLRKRHPMVTTHLVLMGEK
jgi:hypothetical protein